MPNLKIRPLSTGRFAQAEKSNFTYGMDQGVKIQSPVLMWFIEGARHRILVDTGVSDPDWASTYHHPLERDEHENPIKAVQSLGLRPKDIDIIINTHLHWDHCFNNHLFPNARILVQAQELRYAISPLPCHALYYESQLIGMTPSWLKTLDRMESLDGERQIEPGITLIPLPGHTPGFQGVLVDLPSGPCLIAGDTCPLFENWEGKGRAAHIPAGIHVDLRDCYRSYAKMESLAQTILPGHDPKVLERKVYE
jgi:glyoxylase-like metal-dependent hydrolase (beta-lactamase superfamily II)